MKRYTVILTGSYMDDVVRVGEHLDAWLQDDRKVDEILYDIHGVVRGLNTFPNVGDLQDHLLPGLRRVIVRKKAVVFFRVFEDKAEVEVLRIAYGGEDYSEMFKDWQVITDSEADNEASNP